MPLAPTFCIVPPVPAKLFPVTVSPALDPVLLSITPFELFPLTEMLLNVNPLDPIVVPPAIFKAVPVVVVKVFTIVELFCVTFNVPPPVAVKAAFVPVERLIPPEKVKEPPVLFINDIPVVVLVTEQP